MSNDGDFTVELKDLDGVEVFRIVWIKPGGIFCKAEDVTIKIKDDANIDLKGDEHHNDWFKECHNNNIHFDEIRWIELR